LRTIVKLRTIVMLRTIVKLRTIEMITHMDIFLSSSVPVQFTYDEDHDNN
jgi:hypothetical protein